MTLRRMWKRSRKDTDQAGEEGVSLKTIDTEKKNIILIGMPTSGKSTVGVILAKILGKDFIDR